MNSRDLVTLLNDTVKWRWDALGVTISNNEAYFEDMLIAMCEQVPGVKEYVTGRLAVVQQDLNNICEKMGETA